MSEISRRVADPIVHAAGREGRAAVLLPPITVVFGNMTDGRTSVTAYATGRSGRLSERTEYVSYPHRNSQLLNDYLLSEETHALVCGLVHDLITVEMNRTEGR